MNVNKEDLSFKEIIQSTGYNTAPENLIPSVIKRLEAQQASQLSRNASLIPSWIFIGIGILFIVAFFNSGIIEGSTDSEVFLLSELLQRLSFLNIEFAVLDKINWFSGMPKFFYILIPIVAVQFYLMKSYCEGRFLIKN